MSQSLPEHIQRPHIRPIQPIPVTKDGQKFLALRDPQMLQPQTMVIPAPAIRALQEMQGLKPVDQIATALRCEVSQVVDLAQGLDRLGLLWGPTFEELEKKALEDIRSEGFFGIQVSASLGDTEAAARERIEAFFADTEDPDLLAIPKAIVAPHLDYDRGWPNYAAAYYCVRDATPPDRVVVLGTNHFGLGDGVVFTECGFTSPLGRSPSDPEITGRIVEQLGRPVIVDQLDFKAEHSIELHLPWIQYCFGQVPVVAALIPDPISPLSQDDGERITGESFVEALTTALDAVGGTTFFIASSDLSHVGPQFGEPRPVDQQRRFDVEKHDREMMAKYLGGDASDFIEAMRWNKNPTRWCSVGNMAALLQLVQPESVELIDYRQACDDKGVALVSSAAMALS